MTVSTETASVSYAGNGVTVSWAVPYYILESSHVRVTLRSSAGGESIKTLTTDYTVANAGTNPSTATVTAVSFIPATGETVIIERDVPATQETDLAENDSLPAETVERVFDKLTMLAQQTGDLASRALHYPAGETLTSQLPVAASRANKFPVFDALGNVTVSAGTGADAGLRADISSGAAGAVIKVATVAAMKALTGLVDGALVQPKEFYSGDGFRPKMRRFIVDATPPADNGGTVIHDDAATGYFEMDAATEVDIKDFGAKVDNSTDDAARIQACLDAASSEGFIPVHSAGTARIGTKLTVPSGINFRIDGKIRKAANIDMVELSSLSSIYGKGELLGVGGTYTGRGVIITTGGDQDILDVSITDMNGYCVEYTAAEAGIRGTIRGGTIYRTTRTNPAIKFPSSETNGDRKVISVDAEGGWLCDFSGCATVLVQNCNALNFQFGASSKKVCLQGNRIATTGLDLDVLGMNHSISGNIVAGVIDLNSGTNNCQIGPNWDSGVTDNSGSSTNRVYGQAENITPVWNASGTAPAIGNGSISGRAVREGMNLKIFITLSMGSTTTFGTGTYTFTLPSPYSSYTVKQAVGVARALDSGTNFRTGVVITPAGAPTFSVYSDAGSGQWGQTVPFTWATSDTILMQIDCEIG